MAFKYEYILPTYRGGNATEADFVYASGCFKTFHFDTHAAQLHVDRYWSGVY